MVYAIFEALITLSVLAMVVQMIPQSQTRQWRIITFLSFSLGCLFLMAI